MTPATHEAHSRPSFRERVLALAGHSTWREPSQGARSTQRQVPADHMIAAALAFGRKSLRDARGHVVLGAGGGVVPDPHDIGPDIAIDMATGRPANYARICEWAGRAIAGDRSAAARRGNAWVAHVAVAAYNALVRGYSVPGAPDGMRKDDWEQLVLYACLLLEYSAEDALALAGRRARRVA